nr:hypothetical protein [Marseillevirus cajuinensis]
MGIGTRRELFAHLSERMNPLYFDNETPELISGDVSSEEEGILSGETLDSIRDEMYGGFYPSEAYNVLCPHCDVYRGQKNVTVFVRGKTCPEAESFKEFAKFELSTWF